jgi:hypothetical protein
MEYLAGTCDNTCNYSTGAVMDWLKQLVSSETFLFFFAVVGIPMIVMGTIQMTKLLIKHRERMAMIEHGMDPDAHDRNCRRTEESTFEAPPASEVTQ